MKIVCAYCERKTDKTIGHVNSARKVGLKLYCNRKCAGLGRRVFKTKAQKVVEKRLYDIEYRRKNLRSIKAKKRAYFQRTYDPTKAAKVRASRMHLHVAYCRQPSYKRWKRHYDQKYRAGRLFGPYAESFLLLRKIEKEVASRMSKYEIGLANGTINKAMHRRREYERLISG